MRLRNTFVVVVSVLLLAGLFTEASHQESGKEIEKEPVASSKTTQVTLGGASGTPGTSVIVPIYFTPAEKVEVGRIKLDVNFVSRSLKYSKLVSGIAAEMGNVDLHQEIKEGKNEQGLETSTLTVVASFLTEEPPKKGLPSGLLGYLTFEIGEEARTGQI